MERERGGENLRRSETRTGSRFVYPTVLAVVRQVPVRFWMAVRGSGSGTGLQKFEFSSCLSQIWSRLRLKSV
ncbi:hypothetical protein Hdeb2414_s0013g00412171 [Helianthus debilis subsp. tardiflorus]